MVLSFDWMIIFIFYGISFPPLFIRLSMHMVPSNTVTHSLQYLVSFSKYLLSNFYVSGTMWDTRDVTINKTDYVPALFTFHQSGR